MALKSSSSLGLAALWAALATALPAAADLIEPFSEEVKAVTGDWVAENWDSGELKLHPDLYTWQSDAHLTLRAAEPAAGRSLQDVAREHFDGFALDDDTTDPTIVDMAGAETDTPGLIRKAYRWSYGFDDNVSMFGAVETEHGMIVPYHGNCVIDDADYSTEACITGLTTVLFALKGAEGLHLSMPEPAAPISVPGWEASYDPSGTTVLSNRNFHGTVTARVIVTAPIDAPPGRLQAEVEAFSNTLIDELNDQPDEDPGTVEWVGSATDPWIRRTFPEAFSGPSTIMAGPQTTADGKTVLIGLRCPNDGWRGSCARAVSMAQQQVANGQAEERRAGIVSQNWGGFPDGGLRNSDVEALLMTGAPGNSPTDLAGILLMKNGTACRCFDRALGQVVPAESRIEDAEGWGRWEKQGSGFKVVWAGGKTETLAAGESTTLMTGAKPGTRFSGAFTHPAASKAATTGNTFRDIYIRFNADGTFSTDREPISADSNATARPGTYQIDGYNMKLTYPDGHIQWLGFAQAADEAATPVKTQLMLDGLRYQGTD